MTSAMMLIVCTLLFLASKSDGANGDGANSGAKNDASDCQDNKNTGLLADHNCTVICNGSMTVSSPIKAPAGTPCRILDKAKSADETAQNKGVLYGKCQSNSCVTVGGNSTVSTTVTTESSNSNNQAINQSLVRTKQSIPGDNSTTTSEEKESTGATKVTTTSVSSAVTSPPTTVAPSTTGTPDANNTTPTANNTTPAANGSSRSRLVSAAGSQVLGVVLAIGALLLRAP